MATRLIGDETITTDGNVWANAYNVAQQFTCSVSGTMTEYKVKCNNASNIKFAIYSDSADSPNTLLGSTGSVACSVGTNTITFPNTSLTSGTKYWLAFNQESSPYPVATKSGVTGKLVKYKALTYSSSFPDPFGTPDGSSTVYDTAVAGYENVVASNSNFFMFM